MKKADTVIDLIARAFGLTAPEDAERLRGYCELYSTAKTMDGIDECYFVAPIMTTLEYMTGEDKSIAPIPEPEPPKQPETGIPVTEEPELPAPPAPPVEDKPGSFMGKGAGEKRAIFDRLQLYKETCSAGWASNLADASKGKLTASTVRDMQNCGKHALPEWIALGRALDKVVVA